MCATTRALSTRESMGQYGIVAGVTKAPSKCAWEDAPGLFDEVAEPIAPAMEAEEKPPCCAIQEKKPNIHEELQADRDPPILHHLFSRTLCDGLQLATIPGRSPDQVAHRRSYSTAGHLKARTLFAEGCDEWKPLLW
eukprot:5426118-Pyramimonas_sp.AAC.1